MLTPQLFESSDYILRKICRCDKPFGGFQIILCGDFCQLPPVVEAGQDPSFCFQSALWKSAIQLEIELQTVYRQSEPELLDLLSEVRNGGNLSAAAVGTP